MFSPHCACPLRPVRFPNPTDVYGNPFSSDGLACRHCPLSNWSRSFRGVGSVLAGSLPHSWCPKCDGSIGVPECALCGGIFFPRKGASRWRKVRLGVRRVDFFPEVVLPVSAAVPLDYFGEILVKFCCKKNKVAL